MVGWFIENGQDLTIVNKFSKQISEANSSVPVNFEDMISESTQKNHGIKAKVRNKEKLMHLIS